MSLLARKLAEITTKRGALNAEFEHWEKASEAGKPYEKHYSQIRRITTRLEGLLANVIDSKLAVLDSRRKLEEQVLSAFALWEFFRSKLALRREDWFGPVLRTCDEFAWACYAPLRGRLPLERRREPPLVFLNGGWSPFAVPRETTYRVEKAAGGWMARMKFQDVVDRLPLPMIGVPWYQVSHLPDVLVVAHEMGHVVDWEFGCKSTYDVAIARLDISQAYRTSWLRWSQEIFADLYGCLAGGESFAGSLMDFLAMSVAEVSETEFDEREKHPPARLRIELLAAALEQIGIPGAGERMRSEWTAVYGASDGLNAFSKDAPKIAKVVIEGPYTIGETKVRLDDLLIPCKDAISVAESIVSKNKIYESDIHLHRRKLLAAARSLYERDPHEYQARNYGEEILARVNSLVERGVRGATQAEIGSLQKIDRKIGEAWAEELFN